MLLNLDFMPLDQIPNVSLNVFRKRIATWHKTLTEPRMEKIWTPNIGLYLGEPLPYDCVAEKMISWMISKTMVFLSMGQCNFCTRGKF
jgi:hypothetical protein